MRQLGFLTALAIAIPCAASAGPVRVADRDDQPPIFDRDRDRDRDRGRRDRYDDRDRDRRYPGWTRDRYDRYDRSRWARDFRGSWVPLARAYTARSDRQFIPLHGERYRVIRIEGVRGEPRILKVAIEFANRTTQAIDLDVNLAPGIGEVIDLHGGERRIWRIIVYTDPRYRGSYSVYGG